MAGEGEGHQRVPFPAALKCLSFQVLHAVDLLPQVLHDEREPALLCHLLRAHGRGGETGEAKEAGVALRLGEVT